MRIIQEIEIAEVPNTLRNWSRQSWIRDEIPERDENGRIRIMNQCNFPSIFLIQTHSWKRIIQCIEIGEIPNTLRNRSTQSDIRLERAWDEVRMEERRSEKSVAFSSLISLPISAISAVEWGSYRVSSLLSLPMLSGMVPVNPELLLRYLRGVRRKNNNYNHRIDVIFIIHFKLNIQAGKIAEVPDTLRNDSNQSWIRLEISWERWESKKEKNRKEKNDGINVILIINSLQTQQSRQLKEDRTGVGECWASQYSEELCRSMVYFQSV